MLKFVNTGVVFQEIPDQTTLSINISSCPCHCPKCHSRYLWDDVGEPLSTAALSELINNYSHDITCVCFMGGDKEPQYVSFLASFVHENFPNLLTAWYSGRAKVPRMVDKSQFDYIKTGPYIEHLGALRCPTTNQRMYKKASNGEFEDITKRFWSK